MRCCTCTGMTLCPQCQAFLAVAEHREMVSGVAVLPMRDAQPPLTHKAFQAAIVLLAKRHGWKAHYTVNSRKSPAGWPDLVLARLPSLLIAELKVGTDTLSPDQADWLRLLREVPGVEAFHWRPDDWPQIEARITQPWKEKP